VDVLSRTDPVVTTAVTRDPGEVFLLRHTLDDDAVSFVERIDPCTIEPLARSADLPGGAMWPGSLAAHGDGSLHVVIGNHAHRLGPDLEVLASVELPHPRPYNGFEVLPDGMLVTKDFAGSRPTAPVTPEERVRCELVALEPVTLAVLDTCEMSEPSIARISAMGDVIPVVGDTSLLRVSWSDGCFVPDTGFRSRYRTLEGQTCGWDCMIALGAAWFLDDGDGSIGFDGSFEGKDTSTAPLHLVREDLDSSAVTLTEVCGLPGGLIANPPLIGPDRSIAVGYDRGNDSGNDRGNGFMAAFDIAADGSLAARWRPRQNHASHLIQLPGSGVIVTGDHDRKRFLEQLVAIDLETGEELVRADTEGPLQSTAFPAVGHDGIIHWCSMSTVNRVRFG
jgi:hypothetical protein